MKTEQGPLKYVNVCFLYGYHSVYTLDVCYMSVDVRQMFCSISRLNNNEQEYFVSGSVRYINLVRCGRGLTTVVPVFTENIYIKTNVVLI